MTIHFTALITCNETGATETLGQGIDFNDVDQFADEAPTGTTLHFTALITCDTCKTTATLGEALTLRKTDPFALGKTDPSSAHLLRLQRAWNGKP